MFYTNIANLGNNILLRGVDGNKRINQKIPFKPTLYVKAKNSTSQKWKSLEGVPLEPIQFDSIFDSREFVKKYREVENFKIYGQTFFQYAYISEKFGRGLVVDQSKVVIGNIDIEVGSDNGFPEPAHAFEPIWAITLHVTNPFKKDAVNGRYFVFGCKDYNNTRTDVTYTKCQTEEELIIKFLECWEQHYPDIITGWNIEKFDIPYIINRMNRIFLTEHIKRLSPWGKVQEREILDDKFGNDPIQVYEIYGVSTVDYIRLYKKHSSTPNQESYALDHIAFVELGERKLKYDGTLSEFYHKDYQGYIDYNIHDVTLVNRINSKVALLELAMTLAYDNKVNFNDVFQQVRMWDSITNTHLYNKGIIVPPKEENKKDKQYTGAYVKEPRRGRYKWIASFDLDGLYPHLIMMLNMGPDTITNPMSISDEFAQWWGENESKITIENLLEEKIDTSMLKKYNVCLSPNRQLFSTAKKGFLFELMDTMYADRKKFKSNMIACKKKLEKSTDAAERKQLEKEISMLNNFQAAKKVTLNSAYGALGSQYFRFYDLRIAEGITMSGQLAIRWVQNDINKYLNKLCKTEGEDFVIASDTDSMYLNLEKVMLRAIPDMDKKPTLEVIRQMDKFCENYIQKAIQESFERMYSYINTYAPKMSMKREALADVGIWTGKKHYMLNVWNQEGVEYEKPRLKITGLQAVMAGSMSTTCRQQIKKGYEYIVTDDRAGLIKFKETYWKEFKELPVESIVMYKNCNGLAKYHDNDNLWGKKTPFHVKGALIFNNLLKQKGVDKRYQSIKEGEKVRYVYVREPNEIRSNVISFLDILPKELDLHQYIDYDTQFEKSFTDPLTDIMDAVGWQWEEVSTLDKFFI